MADRVPADAIRTFVLGLFKAVGLDEEDARTCADTFTLQELRGIKTHGLRRLRGMLDNVVEGHAKPRPARRIAQERGATLILDGDTGLGIPSCMAAMQEAIRLCRTHGVGFSIVINSNHFLAAAPYCYAAAEAGVIGLAFANGSKSMAYPGTNVGALGNTPMGFGLPTQAGYHFIFDAALTLSGGKLHQWSKEGKTIPDGFLGYDAKGEFTTDPGAIVDGGIPLPIGLHKGAGLGILVDVITGLLAGSTFLRDIVPEAHPEWRKTTHSHSFIAIDIEHFMPLETFKARAAAYATDLKSKPLAPGYTEILMPGERAARTMIENERLGIPLEADVVERMGTLSERFGVPRTF